MIYTTTSQLTPELLKDLGFEHRRNFGDYINNKTGWTVIVLDDFLKDDILGEIYCDTLEDLKTLYPFDLPEVKVIPKWRYKVMKAIKLAL
jgi:hypothetical protein